MNLLAILILSALAFTSLPSSPATASPERNRLASQAKTPSDVPQIPPSSCTPAARIFSEVICEEALAQEAPKPEETLPGRKKLPPPSAAAELSAKKERLRQIIWQKALTHKFGAAALTPTAEEVSAFRAHIKALSREQYDTERENLALLKETLGKKTFAAPYQAEAEEILALLQQSVSFYDKQKEHKDAVPAHLAFVKEEAEKALVTEQLIQWRADKALYEEYGGRLAMAGDRPIPLEAYDAFYDFIKAHGNLIIEAPRYGTKDAYLTAPAIEDEIFYLPPEHDFYKNYFTDPLAQVRMGGENTQSEKLRNWLNSLPIADSSPDQAMNKKSKKKH